MAQNRITAACEVLLIGGSTGSIEVLLQLLPALKAPLRIALILVLHRKNTADSTLVNLLSLKTTIPIQEVDDKDPIVPGTIYLVPADYHVLIERDNTFSLDDSEKVNYSRPSIDVTFESAADVYGPATVGILLSGANTDGTAGLKAIKKASGITVVQKPETAQVAYMPQQAIEGAPIDWVLDVQEMQAFVNAIHDLPN
ncbi:chemotaxis protein CheB [Spirosoma daeguense]